MMQSVCIQEVRVKGSGPLEEETTIIGLTFGGYLRSKVLARTSHRYQVVVLIEKFLWLVFHSFCTVLLLL